MDREPTSAQNRGPRCPECLRTLPKHAFQCSLYQQARRQLIKAGLLGGASAVGAFLLGRVQAIPAPSIPSTIEPGSMVDLPAYTIYKDGSTYMRKNATNGSNDDSGTDPTAVINNALTAIGSAGGGILSIKGPATYPITNSLLPPSVPFTMICDQTAIIDTTSISQTFPAFKFPLNFNYESYAGQDLPPEPLIMGLTIRGNRTGNSTGHGIHLNGAAHVLFIACSVTSMSRVGIFSDNNNTDRASFIQCRISRNGTDGIQLTGGTQVDFYDCHVRSNFQKGARILGTAIQHSFIKCHFDFNDSNISTSQHILGDAGNTAKGMQFIGNDFHGAGHPITGFATDIASQNIFRGNVSNDTAPMGDLQVVKAGAPVDADFVDPLDGIVVVDSTNSKIWTRVGGTWKGVVVA